MVSHVLSKPEWLLHYEKIRIQSRALGVLMYISIFSIAPVYICLVSTQIPNQISAQDFNKYYATFIGVTLQVSEEG